MTATEVASEGRRKAVGYLEVLLAGTLWGLSGPLSVFLFRLGLPPSSVAFLRPAVGALFLVVFLAFVHPRVLRAPPRAILAMVVVGGLIVGVFQLAYQMSTDAIGVPSTVALLYLAPAIVVAVAWPLLGERLTVARAGLALLSVGGVWMTVLGAEGVDLTVERTGLLWGVLCGLGYAGTTVFGRTFAPRYGALAPLLYSTVGGCLVLAGGHLAAGRAIELPASPQGWGILLFFGLTTIAMAPLLLFHAMRTIEAGRAAIGTTVEPFVAALLAMALLDQHLGPIGWVGLVILTAGVTGAYAMRSPSASPKPREPLARSGGRAQGP